MNCHTSRLPHHGKILRLFFVVSCALLSTASGQAASAAVADVIKFDHAEYLKPKTEGQAKDEEPVKGTLAFDKDKRMVEFVDQGGAPVVRIPYDKVKSMLYERTSKPRYAEAVLLSPFFLFTHTKKHFLTIQYTDAGGQGKFAMIHMDKSNARDIVATAEAETGVKVDRSEEK
jgi:hypothetical protein